MSPHTRAVLSAVLMTVLSLFLPRLCGATEVNFRFVPGDGVLSVTVAGYFNEWNASATPLEDGNGDGVWEVAVDLAPGRHPYKFVVDGSEWITDGSAPEFEDDGFGGKNSVLVVGDSPLLVDGVRATIASDGSVTPEETAVRFRFRPEEGARTVSVAGTFNGWSTTTTPMEDRDGDGVFEAVFRLPPGRQAYKFVVDGSTWITDGTASAFEDDGFGGMNSIVEVGTTPLVVGEAAPGDSDASRTIGPVVTFRFAPKRRVNAISVAGSFNEWNAAAHPLSDGDGDGVWEARFRLAAGEYAYEFVIDGDEWVTDPCARTRRDDGFGGFAGLAVVGGEDSIVGCR
ncbi:MAG: hypothetical protein R3E97_21690 [Candidatus Eisenbacteria bacterium]